jgi:hypothetical protein
MISRKNAWAGLRPNQFTLARMASWVAMAAGVCLFVRRMGVFDAITEGEIDRRSAPRLDVVLFWALIAVLGGVGAIWRGVWDTGAGRLLLKVLYCFVIVPFSPLLLFCLDWEGLAAKWRRAWAGLPAENTLDTGNQLDAVAGRPSTWQSASQGA